jgi:conjugal transfer mating pair stabilization protein TraN
MVIGMVILLCSISSVFASTPREMGKECGQQGAYEALERAKKINTKDLMPPKAKKFDPKDAKTKVIKGNITKSDVADFLVSSQVQQNQTHFQPNELFIKSSEKIFNGENKEVVSTVESGYILHKCQQAGNPFIINLERALIVKVQKEDKAHVCLGHTKIVILKRHEKTEKAIAKYKSNFAKDPTIASCNVQAVITPLKSATLALSWRHVNSAPNCHHKQHTHESREVDEEWVYSDPGLASAVKGPDYALVAQTCTDMTKFKIINGKKVKRNCWKEKLSYIYQIPSNNECNFLKQKNCEQIKEQCMRKSPQGCIQWELTFRCLDRIVRKHVPLEIEKIEGTNSNDYNTEYNVNQSFSEVTTKLAVFNQIKNEMEKSNRLDATKIQIFQGKKMQCSKNVADHIMYDCCFRYAGLAKQLKLAKCTADEIGLAEMRELGLCHYVGSYEEKVLDLWKSRDEHVFCCFPSKLARIVQEEGKKQLKMNWGDPKKPNCKGLTTDQMSKLNFSKMDLSEMYIDVTKKIPEDLPKRMKNFKNRLQQDIKNSEFAK